MLNGFKTIAFNVLMIAAVAVLNYLAEVNWTEYLPAGWVAIAPIIVLGVNLVLRFITTSPALGRKPAEG